jgi:hypothetical protein
MIRRIDELDLEHPELGARRMSRWLQREGHPASRRVVSRLMKHMGLEANLQEATGECPRPQGEKVPVSSEGDGGHGGG